MPVAVQMYTVRDFTKSAKGLARSLAAIRELGCEAVQLSAVEAMNGPRPAVSALQARKMLDENGISCIATHRSWNELAANTQAEIDFHHILGCCFTAIGGLPQSYGERGVEGYREFVRDAAPVIQELKSAGIAFGYHNHAHEFERTEPGKTLYDVLIDEAGDDMMLEVDVYWAHHAGINPVRLFERCAGRTPVIHLKDREVVRPDGPVMAAVGEGNLDWQSILPACVMAGVEWFAIEQDVCRRDPFDCLRSSFNFLSSQGL